ncbi:hypothetical protein ABEY31_21480 [Bacillus mycoides]|uniref:hypothetical protein n=1 Tax=Bacillus mycoides TaxID=1405 RepID=UPI003D197B5E
MNVGSVMNGYTIVNVKKTKPKRYFIKKREALDQSAPPNANIYYIFHYNVYALDS